MSGAPAAIPLVLQRAETDCGAACLAMVLAWHGRAAPLDALRAAVGETGRGADAAALLRAARAAGLPGRGFRLESAAVLREVPRGSILHCRPRHYVVLDRVEARGGARVLDPARGPRELARDQLERELSGVVLIFGPTAEADR